jgi:HEAT repeat protein
MGIFDWFTKDGKHKRHMRRMADRDAQPEDREASAHWLAAEGSDRSIYALLTRFDVNLTQQLKDASEKELVLSLLTGIGQPVIGPLRQYLRACKQFALPLRLLAQLAGSDEAVQLAFELLEQEREKSTFQPEKKKGLLVWLAERKHPDAITHASSFLLDFDEDVRYAAVEVCLFQGTTDAREPLLAALARPEEDSSRIRHRIAEAFRARSWSVDGQDVGARLPRGFAVQADRIVSR